MIPVKICGEVRHQGDSRPYGRVINLEAYSGLILMDITSIIGIRLNYQDRF